MKKMYVYVSLMTMRMWEEGGHRSRMNMRKKEKNASSHIHSFKALRWLVISKFTYMRWIRIWLIRKIINHLSWMSMPQPYHHKSNFVRGSHLVCCVCASMSLHNEYTRGVLLLNEQKKREKKIQSLKQQQKKIHWYVWEIWQIKKSIYIGNMKKPK